MINLIELTARKEIRCAVTNNNYLYYMVSARRMFCYKFKKKEFNEQFNDRKSYKK